MRKPLKVAAWCGILSIILGLILMPFVFAIDNQTLLSTIGIILFAPSAVLSILFMYGFVVLGKRFQNTFLQVMAWIGLSFMILGALFGLFANIVALTTNVTAQDEFGQACMDSDGGIDYYTRGYTTTPTSDAKDFCDGKLLYEYSCENTEARKVIREEFNCPDGCFNGRCIDEDFDFLEEVSQEDTELLGLTFLVFFLIFWLIFIIPFSAYSILFGIALMKLDKKVEHSRVTGILNIIAGATYIIFIGFIIKFVAWIFEIILMFKASEKFER